MGAEMNPVVTYLKEKKAGLFSGFREGATEVLTGRNADAQRLLRGVSPADAMSEAHGFGQQAGKGITRGGLIAGGALLAAGAGEVVSGMHDAVTKAHDFKAMLAENQDVAERHQENPRQINRFFSTLRTFNPAFSKDPLVAGTYMRKMMLDPDSAGGLVEPVLNYRDKTRPGFGDLASRAIGGASNRKK
jgi:hypothetical protein